MIGRETYLVPFITYNRTLYSGLVDSLLHPAIYLLIFECLESLTGLVCVRYWKHFPGSSVEVHMSDE